MKHLFVFLERILLLLIGLVFTFVVFTGCSGDDDGLDNGVVDAPPLTEMEKRIVGRWPELGDQGCTFFQGGILTHNGEIGHWQYDEVSKTLTTDIVNARKQTLIWQLNMLQDGSMAGVQVWDGSTFSAKRNIALAVEDILCKSHKSWTRDKSNKFLVIQFDGVFRSGNIGQMTYRYDNNDSWWLGYNDITVSEEDFTSITIASKEYGKHIIHNPYSYDKVWFEFSDGRKYYPVTADMSNLEKVNMSGDESKLVGKWICQEQIWDRKEPGHLYFDDEYGMEFYDDYWGRMWSGKDQLMETMGGKKFVWWIKDGKLYRDNNLYYILKFTDKEMELEWRDGGNIITCKFYKYNESEGLLMDQMEYVDLGLSVKWATRNLGAEDKDASRLGNYYAWGETSPKKEYTPDNYKYCKKEALWGRYGLTKYCSDPHNGYDDFVDNKTSLDPEDDAAIAVRGKEWRMPTMEEYKELIDNCTWEWGKDSYNNVGYKVIGKTGYYVFFPAAHGGGSNAYGIYLSSETGDIGVCDPDVPIITCVAFSRNEKPYMAVGSRIDGYSIRPVHK